MRRLGAPLFLLTCVAATSAADWSHLSTAGDGTRVDVDAMTVRRVGTEYRMWVRFTPIRVAAIPGEVPSYLGLNYAYSIELWYVDCSAQTVRDVEQIYYLSDGRMAWDQREQDAAREEWIPDSVEEDVASTTCGAFAYRRRPLNR